jgi:hypothetical protein
MPKQMEGDNRERRKRANEARDAGKKPSETGATLGASKQRKEASPSDTHEEKLELKREGKIDSGSGDRPKARPRSRDD